MCLLSCFVLPHDLQIVTQEEVLASCVEFSCGQLATYSKLRQLDVLLEQLLPSFSGSHGGHAHYVISSRQFTNKLLWPLP